MRTRTIMGIRTSESQCIRKSQEMKAFNDAMFLSSSSTYLCCVSVSVCVFVYVCRVCICVCVCLCLWSG